MSELPKSVHEGSKYITKKKDCIVPDFSNVSGTYIEDITMRMTFIANRINDLTSQLNVAAVSYMDDIANERECYIRKLKENITDFEAEKRWP